jgi:sigma-E factor negative regulatory protein RseC
MTNSEVAGIINHEGIVQRNEGNAVIISISSASACSGCHSEGSCTMSGTEEKIIEVFGNYSVRAGDKVTILMKRSIGYAAIFLGYVLPFITLITVLIAMISLKVPELASGLIAIAFLIPYYIILYLFRKRINAKFTFTLKV